MIIDEMLPEHETAINVSLVVGADPDATYRAVRDLDLMTVRTPLLTASMWLRGLPDRMSKRAPTPPAQLTLADGAGLPGWLFLGETPGEELAVGAIGQFWTPSIRWRDVPIEDFARFAEPGWGKIVASFSVRTYGDQSLVTYECRTATFDEATRRAFVRYWRLIRPFVGHIMSATLRTIKANAEGQSGLIADGSTSIHVARARASTRPSPS